MNTNFVNGIPRLKEYFKKSKEFGFSFIFGYGNKQIPVEDIKDDKLIINYSGEKKIFPYDLLTDDFGEIFYFLIKGGGGELMLDFNFTKEEKDKFKNQVDAKELAMNDFEDIASEDELEMN